MEAQGKIKSLLELEHNSVEYLHALVEALRHVIMNQNVTWSEGLTGIDYSQLGVRRCVSPLVQRHLS